METNPNITRLLEMLENPEAYSEQEIHDIIDHDEDTRHAYRLLVAAKQGYIHQQDETSADAETAWKRLENEKLKTSSENHSKHLHAPFTIFNFQFSKVAATFIGILFVTGFAFAAIHLWSIAPTPSPKNEGNDTALVEDTIESVATPSPAAVEAEGVSIVFDNVALDSIAKEIAAYHHLPMEIENEEARQLRFFFEWNQKDSLQEVVEKLNMFEHVTLAVENGKLMVR